MQGFWFDCRAASYEGNFGWIICIQDIQPRMGIPEISHGSNINGTFTIGPYTFEIHRHFDCLNEFETGGIDNAQSIVVRIQRRQLTGYSSGVGYI